MLMFPSPIKLTFIILYLLIPKLLEMHNFGSIRPNKSCGNPDYH